jgi:hypothetical protein
MSNIEVLTYFIMKIIEFFFHDIIRKTSIFDILLFDILRFKKMLLSKDFLLCKPKLFINKMVSAYFFIKKIRTKSVKSVKSVIESLQFVLWLAKNH